jgi:hypothetical protein
MKDADCNDNDRCTIDSCSAGTCTHAQSTSDPACTSICRSNADCPANDCFAATCEPDGTCSYAPTCGSDSAIVEADAQPGGGTVVFAAFSEDAPFTTGLDGFLATDQTPAVGTCAIVQRTPPPTGTLLSMGDLQVVDGTTTIVDLTPDASNEYVQGVPAGLELDHDYDLVLAGSTSVDATTLTAVLGVPAEADFTSLKLDGTDQLTDATFAYTPIDADFLTLAFEYTDATGDVVELRCAADPAGTSVTVDATQFAAIGSSGQVVVTATKVRRGKLTASDGDRALVTHAVVSRQGTFTK